MKIVAVIQARMGSTRLPGKVLRDLCGHPVLWHVVQRVRACTPVDEVVVATTTSTGDDPVYRFCREMRVNAFRGSEDDVLSRYYEAARMAQADVVIRITADCPFIDPEILATLIRAFTQADSAGERVDYFSNCLERTFPRGLDAELFRFAALEAAFHEATRQPEREHVTPFLYGNPERFVCRNLPCLEATGAPRDLSRYRLTLDTIEDWQLIEALYKHLYKEDTLIPFEALIAFLEQHPELVRLNAHIEQKKVTLA
jgi:spore coat polysaccharide biosynthesis protein SpsF